jgi:photosystem II stability/assembly factor-like uncharacterized protein
MKALLHILIFILLLTQQYYSQWTNQNPVPDGNDLENVFFINDNIGWIVGSDGFIMKTTNTGIDWIHQNSGTVNDLKEIKFIDIETGWAVGDSGIIIKTTNGGLDWTSLSSGTTNNMWSLHFLNSDTGWVVGWGGTILKTTNGGNSWTSQNVFTHYDLFSVCFVNDSTGWAVGVTNANTNRTSTDSCLILKTTNRGESWFKQGEELFTPYDTRNTAFLTVEFIDESNGFVGGGTKPNDYRRVAKTTNGGEIWIESNLNISESEEFERENENLSWSWYWGGVQDIFFKDINNGFFVKGSLNCSWGGIRMTTNGGQNWVSKFSGGNDDTFNSVFVTDAGVGFVVEFGGRIIMTKDNDTNWVQLFSGNFHEEIYDIFFVNDSVGWAAGGRYHSCHGSNQNVIYKTTNSGIIWKTQLFDGLPSVGLVVVYFYDELRGWASGDGGFYTTTDGGENWIKINNSLFFRDIYFINQDTGWATNNGISKSTDGGITWVQKSSINSSCVYVLDINNGWSVGQNGSILKSTDGGESWISKTSGTSANLNLIRFIDNNIGICIGDSGVVLVSTDGGENWTNKIGPALCNLNFINSTTVWGATTGGELYKTTDFGDTWIAQNTSIGGVTSFFISENKGWVAEDNNIYYYYTEPTAPTPPTNLSAIADTFSVTLNWIDNSSNENGFLVERKDGDSLSVNPYVGIDTVLSDMTSAIDTGLPYNTTYTYRVFAYNSIGNSDYTNIRQVVTLNVAPFSPTSLTAVADTFSVELSWTDNSDNETGFVLERKDGDSLSVNPFIRIDTVLANITSVVDTGLTPNTIYIYRVFAYNNIGSSFYSNLSQITTISLPLKFQLTVSLLDGWNMVSIPGLHPLNQNVSTWWSGKDPSSSVFKFNGSYQMATTVEPGTGYWMKNLGNQTYSTGDEWPASGILAVQHDPINANIGWNLIGGYEYNAAVSGITTTPLGLQDSPVYGYSGTYQIVDYMIPGYGYWIKLSGNGLINLPEQSYKGSAKIAGYIKEDWGNIILTDAETNSFTLYAVKGEVELDRYELPPAPMAGMFDIRFSSGRIAEDINGSVKTIDVSGVKYPLIVRVEGMDVRLMDETGKTINVNLKSGEDIMINDATIQKLMVTGEMIPTAYALEQNYPNPFNPSTVIEFSLPEDVSNVKLSIYNTLGEKVAELVNTNLVAGKYQYQWNAKNVATGMYIYELQTDKFVSVKKMVLLK